MRVVVLGAGYAGLTLARELDGRLASGDEVRVVDETGTHVVQHELHRLIRRPGLADEIELPLGEVLGDATVTVGRVDAIDPDERTVALVDGEDLDYDVAAVCLGAEADFHGVPGLAEHATPLKRIADALAIRERVRPVIERDGRIVVGGAGLSGVQAAGELAELRAAADSDASVLVLEQRETVAPDFDPAFRAAVRDALEARGVAIRTGAKVERADADAVTLADGESVGYDELLWTGGIRGGDAMDGERPVVRSDLRLADRTFALGDAVRVVDDHGERVPASARTAIGQAKVVADNVEAVLDHARTDGPGSFSPRLDRYTAGRPRWLVSVGDGAVAQLGSAVLTGRAALALKTSVGAGYVGRVGPIRNAVDLVRSELGLGGDDPDAANAIEGADADGPEPDDAGLPAGDDDGDAAADDEEYDRLPDGVVEELTDE